MLSSSRLFLFAFFVEALAVVLFTPSQMPPTSPTSASGPALLGQPRPPLPTATLSLEAELARKRQASLFSTDCAYYNGDPYTCPTSEYCAYNQINFAIGCCSLDSSGSSFVSNCVVATQCLNQAQSSLYCLDSGCGADTTVCGVDTNYPDCVTYAITGQTSIYSLFSCGMRPTGSLALGVTVTSYQPPLPPATASSSSKVSCPSECSYKSSSLK